MANSITKARTRRVNPQQLAWGVMLSSFAVFCAIAIVAIIGTQYFLFQSWVPMHAVVQAARGTATLVGSSDLLELAVKNPRDVSGNSVVTTDTQSQASLTFYDPQQAEQLIASVTLKNGSSLNLKQDSRPRFDLSSETPYWIDFDGAYGEFDVYVPNNLDRPILVSFETTLGPSARLSASGRYTLIAAGAQVQVINYSGEALLIAQDKRNQPIPPGQSATLPSDSQAFTLASAMVNLLGEPGFSRDNVLALNETSDQVVAAAWRCNDVPDSPPAGAFGLTVANGRPALWLYRDQGAESHGATLCFQGLGTGTQGLDITGFSRVTLKATFKIQNQSLSECGGDGSECPLMLRIDYYPPPTADGKQPDPSIWYHGFYAFVDATREFPTRCLSCTEDHESINPGAWYTYENRNFLESFAIDQRPTAILNLRFYASGHEYDVYVQSVQLLVDAAELAAKQQK